MSFCSLDLDLCYVYCAQDFENDNKINIARMFKGDKHGYILYHLGLHTSI